MPNEKSFLSLIEDRTLMLASMKAHSLSSDWVRAYSVCQLSGCCERMTEHLSGVTVTDKTLQKELIQDPAFAAYYAKLLPLLPDEPEIQPEPAPSYRAHQRPSVRPISRRVQMLSDFASLVQTCQNANHSVTDYPASEVVSVLEHENLNGEQELIFLENFSSDNLSPEARRTAASSIHNCSGLPLELSQEQKNLLLEPYTASRTLFSRAMFDEIWTLLESCPGVKNILQLLHELGIQENLCLDNYEAMAQNMPEYDRLLRSIARQIDAPAMGNFIAFWKKSCCTLYELRRMERWISTHPGQNWDSLLSNYSGYVNLLYGKRFKQVDLADVTDYQENILIYAITRNKKHFIRLVDEHPEVFLRLPRSSMLFQESLYQEHFNLNELTEKTLSECAGMAQGRLPAEKLSPGYQYSFPELKTLYGLPGVYFKFYAALQSNSKDYKLKVLKQLCRRKLLCSSMTEADLTVLAGCLSVKTLYDWMETNFRHISGLTAEDAVQILIHLDELRHILPTCQSQADVQLALRNLKSLKQYASIEALRENIIQVDTGWKSLAETMGLTPEFLARYHDNILSFLCSDGAYIAKKYSDCLDNQHREAYFRVVKAELMGKLDQLKYFEGDLQRELDSPLTGPVKTGWKRNLYIVQNDLEIRERDDFIATMLLGEQPYHTCLSYINGAHRECLLSSFDSNKKILYATVDGRIVGRAFLRLTKGRLAGENQDSGFTFVDLENAVSRTELPLSREQITLFLERPYISGVGPALEQRVKQMFVELACRKADEMNVTPVLNVSYQDSCKTDFARTRYDIYISASKAGKQYLDSLDGEASVTKEGSYKTNTFLVREAGALA